MERSRKAENQGKLFTKDSRTYPQKITFVLVLFRTQSQQFTEKPIAKWCIDYTYIEDEIAIVWSGQKYRSLFKRLRWDGARWNTHNNAVMEAFETNPYRMRRNKEICKYERAKKSMFSFASISFLD